MSELLDEQNRLHKIVRAAELPAFTGLKSSQIEALIQRGEFPRPVKLSERRKGWIESELIAWQQGRIAGRDKKGGDVMIERAKSKAAQQQ